MLPEQLLTSRPTVVVAPEPTRNNETEVSVMRLTLLLLGRLTRDNQPISEVEWERFVNEIVELFPDGHTAWPTIGSYGLKDGTICRESSHVVMILHSGSDIQEERLSKIESYYGISFNQECVLRIDVDCRASIRMFGTK